MTLQNPELHWILLSSKGNPSHCVGGTTKLLHEGSVPWLTSKHLMTTPSMFFFNHSPLLTLYFRAYMDSIVNGERKPPSFKKLPSCLYDESLADPKLKRARFLRSKPLKRV
jgi:hypothetical protein